MIELLVEFGLQDQEPRTGPLWLCEYQSSERDAYRHALENSYHEGISVDSCITPRFPSIEECQKVALWYGGSFIQGIGGESAHKLQFRFLCTTGAVS